MKTCSFLVTFSLAVVLVNAFSTEEHVKRFFRPEHRSLLPAITSLQLEDESNRAPAPLNDDSTKCLAHCEPQCKKLDVPDFLTVNITLLFLVFQHTTWWLILLNRYWIENRYVYEVPLLTKLSAPHLFVTFIIQSTKTVVTIRNVSIDDIPKTSLTDLKSI